MVGVGGNGKAWVADKGKDPNTRQRIMSEKDPGRRQRKCLGRRQKKRLG